MVRCRNRTFLSNSASIPYKSHFNSYLKARQQLTTDEWIDLLIQSIGFNPAMFGKRSKLTQLVRLIPFCERNYNLIELGPRGPENFISTRISRPTAS